MKPTIFNLCALVIAGSLAADAAPVRFHSKGHENPRVSLTDHTSAHKTVSPENDMRPALPASPFKTAASRSIKWGGTPLRVTANRVPGVAPANLKGCVLQSTSADRVIGIYSIPQNDKMEFSLVAPYVVAPYGGVKAGDLYYAAQMQDLYGNTLYMVETWDTSTWTSVSQEYYPSPEFMASAAVYDPTTGKIYGSYYTADRSRFMLATVDYENSSCTKIADLPSGWNAVAVDTDGTLYAVDRQGRLIKADKETGEITEIGDTGLSPQNLSSGAIDPRTHRFFYAVHSSSEAALYEIDLATGAATWLMDFPGWEEVTGMWVDEPLADDLAPAAVTGLTATFERGALSGKVSFTAPDRLFNDTPATGSLDYLVTANGVALAQGTVEPGADAVADLTVETAGIYEIAVTVSNENGTSPAAATSLFIGPGTPVLDGVTLSRDDENFVISWNPVTESSDGGFIDTEAVTYTVTRYPGAAVVATTSATRVTDLVEEPVDLTSFHYTVTASVNGISSETVATRNIVLGAIIPPYRPVITEDADWDAFTIIDGNSDNIVWMPSSDTGSARLYNNMSLDADDWLITPALRMETGKRYRLSFNTFGERKSYPEKIEVKMGTSPVPLAMTDVLLASTELRCTVENPQHFDIDIIPSSSGKFYIGFHGISKRDMFALHVADISVSAGIAPGAPSAVTEYSVTPDTGGALTADIVMTAPVTDMSGNAITSLDRVELKRDDTVIKTFNSPAPGSTLSFTDNVETSGTYTYRAVAFNSDGAGEESTVKVFVGVNIPACVENLTVAETAGKDGEITLKWNAPALDIDGNPMNPSLITYTVVELTENGQTTVAEDLTECRFTYQAVPSGTRQQLKEWGVFAKAGGRYSDGASAMGFAGAPFEAPYRESFADGSLTEDMMISTIAGNSDWRILDDEWFADIKSIDNDNGFINMYGYRDASSAIETGKIIIPAENPGIMYYVYNLADPEYNADEVDVEINDGSGWTSVSHLVLSQLGATAGWNRRYILLDGYAGKTVRVRFRATLHAYSNVYLDNLFIGSLPVKDMALTAVSIPARVNADKPFSINVTVDNMGTAVAEASDYSVVLYRDGVEIESKSGKRVRSCATAEISFSTSIGVTGKELSDYSAAIVMNGDENEDNNRSAAYPVKMILPLHPVVTDLQASAAENGVTLTWGEPDLTLGSPAELIESFETGKSFAVDEFGDWTFVDADGALTHPVEDLQLPNQGAPMAYVVVDASLEDMNDTWAAADGIKYLAAFCSKNRVNDDWAISPLLYGGRQSVVFQAKTYSPRYGAEEFEFYYSTSGNAIDDFVRIGEKVSVPNAWTTYVYDLPEGSRYFAIRCVSDDRFIFMLDNVIFYPAESVSQVSLAGYNVYRDGIRINETVLEEPEYTDNISDGTGHTYSVTALYDLGESAPVEIEVESSAIDRVNAASISITATTGAVVVTGAEGHRISVYAVDGKTLHDAPASSPATTVPLAPGIYIVKASATTAKVIVK